MTRAEKIRQLEEQRNELIDKMTGLDSKAKDEKRDFTPEERSDFDGWKIEIENYNQKIADERSLENLEKLKTVPTPTPNEPKEIRNYDIADAIQVVVGAKKREGLYDEMHQEAEKEARDHGQKIEGFGIPMVVLESRAMTVTQDSGEQGGNLVQAEPIRFFDALQDKLVLKKLGANFMTGLQGDVPLTKGTAFTAEWEGEVDEDTVTDSTISSTIMQPKRLGSTAVYSKQLLLQSSKDVKGYINTGLQKAIAQKLQATAINGASGGDGPIGILNTPDINTLALGTNGAVPAWEHMIDLEALLDGDNALMGKLAYLTNAKGRKVLKKAKIDSGSGLFAWDKNEINGYLAESTNSVPSNLTKGTAAAICSAIIFGNWEELHFGQWGPLDLLTNPYAQSRKALIEVTINSFWDIGIPRPEMFAAILDALA